MARLIAYNRLDFFRSKVTDGAQYDIKNLSGSPFNSSNRGNFYKNYAFYNGCLFRADDFGNFNYGVAGKAFGLTEILLEVGAGVNQLSKQTTHGFPYGDDPKDLYMIRQGFIYYDTNFKLK